jgi:hypothetical protein
MPSIAGFGMEGLATLDKSYSARSTRATVCDNGPSHDTCLIKTFPDPHHHHAVQEELLG